MRTIEPYIRTSSISEIKWAIGLSSAFILGPLFIGIGIGAGVAGTAFAEKLLVGILWFLLFFGGLWLYGIFSHKDPLTGIGHQAPFIQKMAPLTMTTSLPVTPSPTIEFPSIAAAARSEAEGWWSKV